MDASATLYEKQRQERIAQNKRRLVELGLQAAANELQASAAPTAKRQRQAPEKKAGRKAAAVVAAEPPRRSGRQRQEVNYSEAALLQQAVEQAEAEAEAVTNRGGEREPLPPYSPPEGCTARVIPAVDASVGTRDSRGRLVFEDAPDFRPNLTPKQVIQAGSFGGIYFNPVGGKPGILGSTVDITHEEFPPDWFEGLPPKAYRARTYTIGNNKYGVKAGQDQAFWEGKGWINAQDPRGWFHWYCRFYQGRRTEDDARQISRWKGVVGDKGRWVRALVNKIIRSNKRWDDATVSPVIRQTLLHWAFELTEDEFQRMQQQL